MKSSEIIDEKNAAEESIQHEGGKILL